MQETVFLFLFFRTKKKPSRFKAILDGLTRIVSLATKLKNLFDLFH